MIPVRVLQNSCILVVMEQVLDPVKKQRERDLIEQFISICPKYSGWAFESYSENPDMIYTKGSNRIGFDSVIISDDQASVQCVYSPELCQISLPGNISRSERLNKIETFFANKLFTHLRKYSVPTVLVFTLVDTQETSFADIINIAKKFKLPKLEVFNIQSYYLCDNSQYVKIAST